MKSRACIQGLGGGYGTGSQNLWVRAGSQWGFGVSCNQKGQGALGCMCSAIDHIRPLVTGQFGLVCFWNTASAWYMDVSSWY